MIICPKCGSVLSYNSYFRLYICDKCNWEGKREPLKTTKITTKTSCVVKRSFLTIVLFIIIFSCSSCSSPFSFSKTSSTTTSLSSNYKLNKRQKSILKREGLPTDYNKLNVTQKSSIEAIETLLCYLEDKYPDDEFFYKGYVQGALPAVEKEHLIVYSQYGVVTVYREYLDNGTSITDDYNEVKASDKYATQVNDFINKYVDDDLFAVSVKINKIDNKKHIKNPISSCSAAVSVYVNENAGKKKYKEIIKKTKKYLSNNVRYITSLSTYLVKENEFLNYAVRENDDDSFNVDDFVERQYFYNTSNNLAYFEELSDK